VKLTFGAVARDQSGSAVVEFTFLVVGMLLPFTWVVATLASIHATALAVDDVAKQAARAFSLSSNPSEAMVNARWLASEVTQAHGLASDEVTSNFVCEPTCLQPGGTVTAEVRAEIGLGWVPRSWGLPGVISINALHVERIDFHRNTP
jgi:Flp pilus assembly protein TadG